LEQINFPLEIKVNELKNPKENKIKNLKPPFLKNLFGAQGVKKGDLERKGAGRV